MKSPSFVLVSILLLLVGCTSPNSGSQPQSKVLGLLKVTISGIGEGAAPTASAEWVRPQPNSGVSTQSTTVINVNGTSAIGDLQLSRRAVSFYDNDTTLTRYVQSTFDLVNRTKTDFNNLTLVAVNVPTNIGGTGIALMSSATGVAITDPNIARGFKPIHGMYPGVQGLDVNPRTADLQLLTPAEASGIYQADTDPNFGTHILPAGSTVLEYGFVARNYTGGRLIASPNTATASDCTILICKGTVTLGYKFPRIGPRANNPFSFTLYFLVVNETDSIGSQSIEEQSANTVMGLNTITGFSQLRTLAGSSYGMLDDRLTPLCCVRTAVGPDAYLGPDPLPSTPGSLDVCFGIGGKRISDFIVGLLQYPVTATAMTLQPDGKIVVVGYTNSGGNFSVSRYNPNGTPDMFFGTAGRVKTSFGSSTDAATSVAVQSDGKIVVAGVTSNGSNTDFALVRYNPNGTLDTSFNGTGKLTTDFNGSDDRANAVAVQTDGKIVAAGNSGDNFSLARYNANGTFDTAFNDPLFSNNGGKVVWGFGGAKNGINSMALQSDGKIVVAGWFTPMNLVVNFAFARFNTNGLLDSTLNGSGIVTTALDAWDSAQAVAIYPSITGIDAGKIVLAGYTSSSPFGISQFALVRYNPNGSLDTTFNGTGKVTNGFGIPSVSLGIQLDGKILVGGNRVNSDRDFALVRYDTNGSLDTSFNGTGQVSTSVGVLDDFSASLAIQSDGKIVMAGSAVFGNATPSDFALVRYNP